MADTHVRGLTTSRSGILESSKDSDMTVRCGSEEFKLHKAIVCPRSKFFAEACDGQSQVIHSSLQYLARRITLLTLQFQEAETSTIVLEDDDPPSVRRMLTYLYTLAYDDEGDVASAQHYQVKGTKANISQAQDTMTAPPRPPSAKELSRHVKMINNVIVCAIAQKYGIEELKDLAIGKFRELLWLGAPNPGLPDIINAVFDTTSITDPGLRNVAVEFCTHYIAEIVADARLCSTIKVHGDLGLGMLKSMHVKHVEKNRQLSTRIKQLQSCQKIFFFRAHDIRRRVLAMMGMASSMTIPDKSGDASSHTHAQNSLKTLVVNIKQLHNKIAKMEDWEDTGLETRSPSEV